MILGQRVRLRPTERADLPRYVEWFANPQMRSHLSLSHGFSLEQEEQWYQHNLTAGDEQSWAIDARVKAAQPGAWEHIGSCGLRRLDGRHRSAELGIAIGPPEFWGRGFGTDAVLTLCGWGFNELNLHRIFLQVFADNARAMRAYTKAGFVEEGRQREANFHNGRYRDTIFMSLLRPEWQAQQAHE
jgi:RimJ/RimL family protein N-acetyltransferase